ncbi:MAG: hypothetical protein M1136_04500 [Chloroflexi bacterium]|nr:hypothetical protein [Chloroflexota bacterium]MCL5074900.1 hypothetical protein [Chloroflexota bacterium]
MAQGEQPQPETYPAGKQEVELYIRTYNTLLRSSGEIKMKALLQAHLNIDSSLHPNARNSAPDLTAFIYCTLRLPPCIMQTRRVVLGQSAEVFSEQGFGDVERWPAVKAAGRRRKWFFDGQHTLAVYIASASDVDDLIPILVAFQIEWNKFYRLLNADSTTLQMIIEGMKMLPTSPRYEETVKVIRERLLLSADDWVRLEAVWGENFWLNLLLMGKMERNFAIRMLGGSHVGYAKATRKWWAAIGDCLTDLPLAERPVYFVSSNTHSLVNPLSGFALRRKEELEQFVKMTGDAELLPEYEKLQRGEVKSSRENFLYYTARKYSLDGPRAKRMEEERRREEEERGIYYVRSTAGLDIDAQIIDLARLIPRDFDPRLQMDNLDSLKRSNAIVLNIEYPLGLAAYHILRQLAEQVGRFKGIYILGKAATLNGSIGDVMIPNVVFDEHSGNTYWLDNCFTAQDISPFLIYGSVLDNQKTVSVKGTFLQNRQYLELYYRESYTVVEMEAGPYLNALYESIYPTRYPVGENINFTKLPFVIGLLHYASDTPYTRGKNLGAKRQSYYGMDSAYATSIAILRHILSKEVADEQLLTTEQRPSLVL